MTAYYNEFKPEAAHMLRQLIRDGLIAAGDVDERSIEDVKPDDIKKYTQCHFFAGIGGWSVALRQAMWADERPVWTGSCPCQPFSSAGKQKGKNDERHLWPVWFRLIAECRPAIIFGEQVAAAIAHGWWDDVANDLENEGYACGAAVLPACSVGKPHKRDRLWFVANATQSRTSNDYGRLRQGGAGIDGGENPKTSYVGDTRQQCEGNESVGFGGERQHSATAGVGAETGHRFADAGIMGDTRLQRHGYAGEADIQWLICPDGKTRPVKRGISLLAHGVQHRTPILHAFGNAIVPQVAAEFIKATERGII